MAPNVGSILYSYVGYRVTCDILALTALLYALAYFITNVGLSVLANERKHKEALRLLESTVFPDEE